MFLGLEEAVLSLGDFEVALAGLSSAEKILLPNRKSIHLQILCHFLTPHHNIAISHRRRPIRPLHKPPLHLLNINFSSLAVLVKLRSDPFLHQFSVGFRLGDVGQDGEILALEES